MGTFRVMLAVSLLFLSLVGCSTVGPQARLATYFGANSTGTSTEKKTWAKGPTGLVVINDTSFGNSAPQLSEESLHAIKQHVEARLTKEVSMALEPLEFPHQSALPVESAVLLQQAKDHQMDYLVLAVVSST
ncbi:MAG: hypothetical protein O2999_14650 [Nitrospirae bacterium]|nr:hypothetical protein [Nitrospirota bacterium]MDA1305500.1 hypothetical protein [Nitrospirota bacterium]